MSYEIYCRQCGCQMKLRAGKYGEFYGCTGYPACRATMRKQDAELNPDVDDQKETPRWDY